MDEQLKVLLEGINALKSCQEDMQRSQEEIKKGQEAFQALVAQRQNQEKRNFKCWGCGETGHLRRNCPRSRKDENTVSSSKQEN
ncbi:hypothetical protein TNCV_3913531 [Trichonephila clavipes]|nr:hypothetical protein TNCV_3913531 [Trichonephila clavipes]